MEKKLERTIVLQEQSELKNLYQWFLQEFDEEGKKIEGEQVGWLERCNFNITCLRLNESINIKRKFASPDSEKIISEIKEEEGIYGEMVPDNKFISYSMFGTGRKINNFNFHISKVDKENPIEKAHLAGCIGFQTSVGFRNLDQDDFLELKLWVNPERFNKLVDIVKSQNSYFGRISLRGVQGFYSLWSPEIDPRGDIKVLATNHCPSVHGEEYIPDETQIIKASDNSKIIPRRLGEIYEFDISIQQQNKLIITPEKEDDSEQEEEKIEEPIIPEPKDNGSELILAQLLHNQRATGKLLAPLWMIFIVIILMVLFK